MATRFSYSSLSTLSRRSQSPIEMAENESLSPLSEPNCPHGSSKNASHSSLNEGRVHRARPATAAQSLQTTEKKPFDWAGSWMWEIASAVSSVICIALLIGFLAYINGTPYEDWKYRISPNAVVSVIATAAKAAMIIPVSSCLSQIKWNHYKSHNPLYHIQVLDQASRGPLGACKVLWRLTPGLATAGAMLMILSVAIDPFTQQILVFPSRAVEARNETASIQKVQEYSSSWASRGLDTINENTILVSQTMRYNPDPALLVAILSGLSQQNEPLDPVCTTGRCWYRDFVSLGVCNYCEDVTSRAFQECKPSDGGAFEPEWSNVPTMCNYTSPNGFNFSANPRHFGYGDGGYTSIQNPWTSKTRTDGRSILGIHTPIVSFFAAKYSRVSFWTLENKTLPEEKPEMTECAVYFCEREYTHNNFTPSHSIQPSRSQQLLYDTGLFPTNVPITLPNGAQSLSDNSTYAIEETTLSAMKETLENLLNTTIVADNPPSNLDISTMLYTQKNITEAIAAMANSMTDEMRSSTKSIVIGGHALLTESFIHVRWLWIIFTGTIVALSIMLLTITVMVSRRQYAVLWKSSVLPLLISHVQPRAEHDMDSIRNVDKLERISKNTTVLMEDNQNGLYFTER